MVKITVRTQHKGAFSEKNNAYKLENGGETAEKSPDFTAKLKF